MNERLPWYKHLYCNCGWIIYTKDCYTVICDRCGKESNIASINYKCVIVNDKTGWMYPVSYRKD